MTQLSALFVVAATCVAVRADAPPAEVEKAFPDMHFRYRLPGSDWEWQKPAKGAICQIAGPDDVVVNISAIALPDEGRSAAITQGQADQIDKTLTTAGGLTKVGGKFIDYAGARTYQGEYRIRGKAAILRSSITKGVMYQVMVMGPGNLPDRPDLLRDAFDGFTIDDPTPSTFAPSSRPQRTPAEPLSDDMKAAGNVSELMGKVAFGAIAAAVALAVLRSLFRSKRKPKS